MSKLFNLDLKDLLKGMVVAVLAAVLTIIYNTVQAGSLTFDWKAIGTAGITAAAAYLLKNLQTNSKGEFLKNE